MVPAVRLVALVATAAREETLSICIFALVVWLLCVGVWEQVEGREGLVSKGAKNTRPSVALCRPAPAGDAADAGSSLGTAARARSRGSGEREGGGARR